MPEDLRGYDAVIVGGGPAGATCGLWLKMLGFRPIVVERKDKIGGLQAESPYPNQWVPMLSEGMRGIDVAATMHETLLRHRIPLSLGRSVISVRSADSGFEVITPGRTICGRYLVLGTGVAPADGGLRASPRVLIGPGHGIATFDFRGKSVAILGGGDNAFENFLFILDRGASEVVIFARTLLARAEFLEKVSREDVVLGDYEVDTELMKVNGRPFDVICVLYGWQAQLPPMLGLSVAMDSRGFVRTGADCETSLDGVFAVGELARRAHPCAITAMADGVVAAKAIQRRLERDAVSAFIGGSGMAVPAE